ncbi:phage minor capsid protein [Nonomuraea sp. NPDC050663]|uniref:phage minor capsid protein n=1 Tax=Nonomuraea sp. NPDC050663 TaxID=3364370 RepID=UPI0037B5C1B8
MATVTEQVAAALAQAEQVARIYEQAELDLLEAIAKHAAKDTSSDDADFWASKRLADIQQLRKEAARIVARLDKAAKAAAKGAVNTAWQAGVDKAIVGAVEQVHDEKLKKRLARVMRDARKLGSSGLVNQGQGVLELAEHLTGDIVGKFDVLHLAVLRVTDDIYRKVIGQVAGPVLAGSRTLRDAVQDALNQFAAGGIKGFVDAAGRAWGMREYAEMATRTATARAAVEGELATLGDAGLELVIVSRAPSSCSVCDRWENKVLAHRGAAGQRQVESVLDPDQMVTVEVAATVSEARAAGLLHPNCRHSLTAYLPGVTTPAPVVDAPSYEATQKQRALERKVREWKKKQAVAVDDHSKQVAKAKVEAWQQALAAHVADEGLRRKRGRERLMANETMPAPYEKKPPKPQAAEPKSPAADRAEAAPPPAAPSPATPSPAAPPATPPARTEPPSQPEPARSDTPSDVAEAEPTREEGPDTPWHHRLGEVSAIKTNVDSGEASRRNIAKGIQGVKAKVQFVNGTEGFHKQMATDDRGKKTSGRRDTDAEQLSSLLGRAIGAPVPRVYRTGEAEYYTDWVEGDTAAEYTGPDPDGVSERLIASREGLLLGLLDVLTANTDRHLNNWMIGKNGELAGIDHGLAWEGGFGDDPLPLSHLNPSGPFASQLFSWRTFELKNTNRFTPEDIAVLRTRLEALRPDFALLGREQWLDYSLHWLNQVGRRATGTTSIVAP